MLDFVVEWHDAPGVKDAVLAKTWARLEIHISDYQSAPHFLTQCIRSKVNSVHRGVYSSVFPLAEWVVENWWFLLFEPIRVAEYHGGRRSVQNPKLRHWVQRHNLLAAREGGALPDLTFFRDERDIVARWFPDPESEDPYRPIRFISGTGEARLDRHDLERALDQFVRMVLERLDSDDDEDSRRLRDNWQALCRSRTEEADICGWAASLGVDPYDADQLDERLIDLLEQDVARLPLLLRADLLGASVSQSLQADLDWVKAASGRLSPWPGESDIPLRAEPTERKSITAYQFGYNQAHRFRASIDMQSQPIPDLAGLLHQKCGWPEDPKIILESANATSLDALVGSDAQGYPRIVERPGRPESHQYRLARALFIVPDVEAGVTARLITRGFNWDQSASRAFAAELLAPADLLRSLVDDSTTCESIGRLAQQLNVSAWVIEHQLENHGIASIEA
jgi:hypothetical protein